MPAITEAPAWTLSQLNEIIGRTRLQFSRLQGEVRLIESQRFDDADSIRIVLMCIAGHAHYLRLVEGAGITLPPEYQAVLKTADIILTQSKPITAQV